MRKAQYACQMMGLTKNKPGAQKSSSNPLIPQKLSKIHTVCNNGTEHITVAVVFSTVSISGESSSQQSPETTWPKPVTLFQQVIFCLPASIHMNLHLLFVEKCNFYDLLLIHMNLHICFVAKVQFFIFFFSITLWTVVTKVWPSCQWSASSTMRSHLL